MAFSFNKESLPEWVKSILDPHGYGLAIVIAVALHAVVIALFMLEWPQEKKVMAEPTPRNIQAKVIQVENKQVAQRKAAEKKQQAQKKRAQQKRKEQEAQRQKRAREKALKAKAQKEKALKEKALKEKAIKDNAAKKKAAEEKARQAAKEAKKREQEALKAQEQRLFEQAQEQALLDSLADEEQQRSIEKALADELQAQKNAAITDDIAEQIRVKISRAWRYPPSARPDMRVEVAIQLVPTGEVIQVSLVSSSGNEALDRSVLSAVKRAQPLPVPNDNRLFEQKFRNFSMGFSPKDAVW